MSTKYQSDMNLAHEVVCRAKERVEQLEWELESAKQALLHGKDALNFYLDELGDRPSVRKLMKSWGMI